MKILFFITGHRQLDEYKLQSFFFKRFTTIKNFDVLIHSNSSYTYDTIKSYSDGIPNHKILSQQNNTGYVCGLFTALYENFDKFRDYDLVVHLHPDVFITDDDELNYHLLTFKQFKFDIMSSYTLHTMKYNVSGVGNGDTEKNLNLFYSTDFFVFDPSKIDANFFDSNFNGEAEHILKHNIDRYGLKVYCMNRHSRVLQSLLGKKDSSCIWHSHNLKDITEYYNIK